MTATYRSTRDIPLGELTPFPGNARRGDVEAIRASLRRNGQQATGTRPILEATGLPHDFT